jgi:hypothetical protein
MADATKIGLLLERMARGVAAHDREHPDHHTWGIGMAYFDIDRLGLEDGEEILPGILLKADGGMTGQFRILCDGRHDGGIVEEEEEEVEAVADEEVVLPVPAPGNPPEPPTLSMR